MVQAMPFLGSGYHWGPATCSDPKRCLRDSVYGPIYPFWSGMWSVYLLWCRI